MIELIGDQQIRAAFYPNESRDNILYLGDRPVLSWGPRVTREDDPDTCLLPGSDESPDFYTVFLHGERGHASAVADVATEKEAVLLVRALFPSVLLTEQIRRVRDVENGIVPVAQPLTFLATAEAQITITNITLGQFVPRD